MVETSLSSAGGSGLIPGQEAEVPHASWSKHQNVKQEQYCKKFSKTLTMAHILEKSVKGDLKSRLASYASPEPSGFLARRGPA